MRGSPFLNGGSAIVEALTFCFSEEDLGGEPPFWIRCSCSRSASSRYFSRASVTYLASGSRSEKVSCHDRVLDLVRVRLPGGAFSPPAFETLDAAESHGDPPSTRAIGVDACLVYECWLPTLLG